MSPKQSVWFGILPMTLLALAIADLARAEPQATPTPTSLPSSSTSTCPPAPTCGFIGDNNTYGIGVRLGIYLQWLGSTLAYNWVPEEARGMRGVNLIFTLSNFAGLIYITATQGNSGPSGNLYAVECWIVLSFCLGGICSGQVSGEEKARPTKVSFAGYDAASIGRVIQFVIWAATVYYTIWFLYVGMDTMMAPSCSRFAFFFTKVDLFHWFRTFLKVLFTIAAIGFSTTIIMSCATLHVPFMSSKHVFRMIALQNNSEQGGPQYALNLCLSLALVFFVVSTELTIKWNHIQQVNTILSTGQILPIVVGGGSLLRTIWKFWVGVCIPPEE